MAGRNDAASLTFFVIGISSCFVLPCFATGCRASGFKIATAAVRPRTDTKLKRFYLLRKGISDSIAKSDQRGILFQIEVWKLQESFTYFKIFKPISWDKRPAERRSRFIQRFPRFSNRSVGAKDPLTAAVDLFRGSQRILHAETRMPRVRHPRFVKSDYLVRRRMSMVASSARVALS